jgi:Fic family protein
VKNRAGEYKINLSGELQYKSFLPKFLPPNPPIYYDSDMIYILSKANRSLGILEGISSQVSNVDLFVSMYIRKEALLSSQIEGTQATLDDILDPDIGENTNLDIADVINYIKAFQSFQYGKKRLNDLLISS